MRTLVLGAGGIGGFFGGHLARSGADVTFLVRERRATQLREHGLIVKSPLGDFQTPARAVTDAAKAAAPDIVILACKAYDLGAALDAIAPPVKPGTAILPLLNGLVHLDRIEKRFPDASVWGGLAHLGITLTDDGTLRHLNDLSVIQFGPRGGRKDARAETLAAAFASTPVQASVRATIEQDMWDKFVFLSTLAGITCLMRANIGTILPTPSGEKLILGLLGECRRVAATSGFPPADSQIATYRLQLTRHGSASKASMLRDIERGAPTEADHVLGDMFRRARALAIDTPLLEIALTHLQTYEAARRAA